MPSKSLGRKRSWTDSQLVLAVSNNHSIASSLRSLGLSATGANYKTVHGAVRRLGVDTSHWTGCGHRKGIPSENHKQVPLIKVLVEHGSTNTSRLKRRLVVEGLLEDKCSLCGQEPTWNGSPLMMILDHANGINDDFRLPNLRLLCPNCNSQQPTFAGRNIRGRKGEGHKCGSCGGALSQARKTGLCIHCRPKTKAT